MQKILVLRGGALGDFIVTLPALALLRERWPAALIELVGNAPAAALAVNRGLLHAAHSQHEARWSAFYGSEPLPASLATWLGQFDLVLNYWPDPDGALRRVFPLHGRQTILSADAMPFLAPAAAHYCEPLRALGLKAARYVYPLYPVGRTSPRSAPPAAGIAGDPAFACVAPIALHPGSGSRRKNWPIDRWVELIEKLASPVVVVLGEAELERWNELNPARSGSHVRVLSRPPLETLVAELSGCRLFLGHDSGISHLAAACGVPSLLLFGPTDPKMWAPPAPYVRVLQRGADLGAISISEVLGRVAQM